VRVDGGAAVRWPALASAAVHAGPEGAVATATAPATAPARAPAPAPVRSRARTATPRATRRRPNPLAAVPYLVAAVLLASEALLYV
ncbi:hypothetical protein MHY85_20665, partial [Cellulomonas sp. ACRRI]|nr:hypothetical protein [Cellulomonas sp. ACRRI]